MSSNYGEVNQNMCKYGWKINDFFNCCKNVGECISSPDFLCGNNNEFKWRLQLYPFGYRKEDEEFLSIFLHSLNDYRLELTCKFMENTTHTVEASFKFRAEFKPHKRWGFYQFIKRSEIASLMQVTNNCLTLTCEISNIITFTDFSNHIHGFTSISNTKLDMLNDFEKILNDDFCDVTISVNGKEFRAHKNILAARSTVFTAMFRNNMIEKKTNSVIIENIKHEIFEKMLKYIYTGEVDDIETITKDLLVIADKYDIIGLRNICAHKIYETINTENAINLLIFADTYNVDTLKNNIIDFIVTNAEGIINVSEFKLLENVSPKIFTEIFRKLALQKKK